MTHRLTYANAVLSNTAMANPRNTRSTNPPVNTEIPVNNETLIHNDSHNDQTHSQTNSLSIDNNAHPLFLHNNDQPGMILISKKLLGSENYASWKRSLQIALSAKNKLVIVNGEYLAPAVNSPLFVHWKRVNDMVIALGSKI